MLKKINYYLFFVFTLILIFIDFISKNLAEKYLEKKINLIGDFFYLQVFKNPGIAFSIDIPYLKIVTIIIIFIILFYYFKYEKVKNNFFINLAFVFILAGAIGNAWERIFIGEVVDFIGVKNFSVFNFADIFINIGFFIYIFVIILKYDKK